MMRRAAFAWIAALLFSGPLSAHELQTAVLRLQESPNGHVRVVLKTPVSRSGEPSALVPHFDPRCTVDDTVHSAREPLQVIREWSLHCEGGLQGTRLRLQGLDPRMPEAVLVAHYADGRQQTLTADRHDPVAVLEPEVQTGVPLQHYLPLGIEHILLGPDHLLFVLGLMLVIAARGGGWRVLLLALTAFTVAHSLTLGLAMFGLWGLPPRPVEILIALSIVLLAVELAEFPRRQQRGLPPTLTMRKPWLVAFVFGLLHGFGFAGALSDIGLPASDRGWALLLFNLGVEVGQLLFVAATLGIRAMLQRWPTTALPLRTTVTVLLGGVAVYWTLDRAALWLQASGWS